MDKIPVIKNLLSSIKAQEGERFVYDEEAILNAYKRDEEEPASLAIKILSIVGGFAATIAFMGFLMIGGLYDSKIGLVVFGILFIAIAVWLNKSYERLIIDTVSVSLYVFGFVILIFGMADDLSDEILSLICLLVALATLRLMQNYILSFLAVLVINGSLYVLVTELRDTPNTVHFFAAINTLGCLAWMLNEAKLITGDYRVSRLYYPVRIGLIVSLLIALSFLSMRHFMAGVDFLWLTSLVTIPATIYVVIQILNILKITENRVRIQLIALAALILIPTVNAPYISGSILVLLLSFLVNYKTGLVFSIVAIVYFVSRYYYDLNISLLYKSIMLFASGLLFLGAYLLVHKKHSDEAV